MKIADMLKSLSVVFVFLFFIIICDCSFSSHNDKKLENVVKQILNISPPKNGIKDEIPPKHMIELYQRFISGKRASGETVRSITPFIDSTGHRELKDTLIFNVTQIDADEEVRAGQLLLHRRRVSRAHVQRRGQMLAPPCRVRLYHLIYHHGHRIRALPLASIPVPQASRGGWHSVDITAALRELLVSSSAAHLALGVRFEAPKSKVISPHHFLNYKENCSAFLMLFTEDATNDLTNNDNNDNNDNNQNNNNNNNNKRPHITPQHIQLLNDLLTDEGDHSKKRHSHLKIKKDENPKRHKHMKLDDGNDGIKELLNMERIKLMKRHKYHQEQNSVTQDFKNFDRFFGDSATRRVIRSIDSTEMNRSHRRRSIFDNELPYEKLYLNKQHNHRVTTTTEQDSNKETTTELVPLIDEEEDEKNLIPYPPGMKRRRKKNKNKRIKNKRNQRSKVSKFPDEWHQISNTRGMDGLGLHPGPLASNHTCSRRHLQVTFKDLGWSSWIVAPLQFDVDYCAGSCSLPVPQTKRTKTHRKKCDVPFTNHAVVQGLVHKVIDKDIPEACCVPHAMNPLTVLYFEDENHVILKNYRSMTVDSCGCR